MNSQPILVQMGETRWTWAALYAASNQARATRSSIALVKLLPEGYLTWLADDCQQYHLSESEAADFHDYEAIAAENGVNVTLHMFEYKSLEDGLVQAADALNARAVYANVPPSSNPFRHDAPLRHLGERLGERDRELHTIDIAIA